VRIGVVGAGIVGLAVARRIGQMLPDAGVTVLEKEDDVAQHQTGRNSGVVHAGIYYRPGTLKAQLCLRGKAMLAEYCAEQGLPYVECGKLVVALDATETAALREIQARSEANGVPGLRWLDGSGIREVEPHAVGVAALHSPHTAITDYVAVARSFAADVRTAGGEVRLGAKVEGIRQAAGKVFVTLADASLTFDRLVLCAGLQSDQLATLAGDDDEPVIVPFRGEYLRLDDASSRLVRGLIYPVPDPDYPFLGVHFTRHVDGTVDIGPNAVLATAREGYLRRNVSPTELWETVRWPGFRKLARAHWRMGLTELAGSASRTVFVRRAQRYVPELGVADVRRAGAGIRAQAVDRDGSLVDDFRINAAGAVLAVRNAPSPAATSSLAIAEHVCATLLQGTRGVGE
jgi:L-2-hydroxyglutarate oxidase LhgO